jgi:hypothetical protein
MKKYIFTLLLIILAANIMAQVPAGFNYQAVVRNSAGEIVASQAVRFQFSILKDSETGTIVYKETQSVSTNDFGLVNLVIGSGTPVSGSLEPASWSESPHFLKVELDPNNGTSYNHMATIQLMAVPYAFHSQTVKEIPDKSVTTQKIVDGAVNGYKIAQGGAKSGQTLKWNGRLWAPADDNLGGGDGLWAPAGDDVYFLGGKVGIGTQAPLAQLHVNKEGDQRGNVLFNGELSMIPGDPPAQGTGTRMMWYPDKAAFRAGAVIGDTWDKINIGPFSFAAGYQTKASGYNSVALGESTEASASSSAAIGSNTTASGTASAAFGYFTTARSYGSLAAGRYNVGGGSPTTWVATDPVFEIGIGSSSSARSNAITILKNGRTGIGTAIPRQQFSVGEYLDIYSGYANSPQRPSIRSSPNNNLIINSFGSGILYFNFDEGTGETRFYNGSGEKELMHISSDGKVGIGTGEPEASLDINGSLKVGAEGMEIEEIRFLWGDLDSNGEAEVPYPPGFDMLNTIVLSCQIYPDGYIVWKGSSDYQVRGSHIYIHDDMGSGGYRLVVMRR